jgi:hypothetical protein
MRRPNAPFMALFGLVVLYVAASMSACGGSSPKNDFSGGSSGGSGSGGSGGGSGSSSGVVGFGDDGGSSGGHGDGGTVCPAGLQCNVQCSGGGTTSIKGAVYDPAKRNPIYGVAVYVPASPLQPLPKGVPTGSDACSCEALYKSGAVVATTTGVDGTFELDNAPVGSAVPLVVQIGKWRKQYTIDVTACQPNQQQDKTLLLPNSVPPGDTNTNMPDIAVSTGSADSLECLMTRIGLPPTEYVAGTATGGHIHVYSGGNPAGGLGGAPEPTPFPAAPESDTSLWDTSDHMMPYDIVLLSCEGDETYNAIPANLETYLNAGGRAFASHFHYAWFSGALTSGQTYTPPMDWGTNLATWAGDGIDGDGPVAGTIVQTLNGSTKPFPKGVILDQWLQLVMALGQNGVPTGDLSIYDPRYNAVVAATNVHSQPWITSPAQSGTGTSTMYFSFDTPVDAPDAPDGGPPSYCGRAVFSDLHVGSNPATNDSVDDGTPAPDGCADGALSPQEDALEFMLFDLSSCVIPDTVEPPDGGPILQ